MARVVGGFCPLDCPDTCAWHVEVDDAGRAVSLRGDKEHPFTRGALCGKVNRYLDAVYGPDRLLHPLKRVGAKGDGRFARISWDEALELAAAGIREAADVHGPESVLPYYFAGTMGCIQGWTLGPRLFRYLGASQLVGNLCSGAADEALALTLGGSVGYDPEDIVHARLVILWGANPLNTNVHQWRFIAAAREAGAHLVTIDPIRSESAARSDDHLALLPGTDAALALGLMRAVLDAGAEDRDWLDRHTVGWSELERRLEEWPVERAARTCGLTTRIVRRLGERLAATRPTALRIGLGLQRHGGAGAAVRAIVSIPAVTGDWRHVGGGALCMTSGHFPYSVPEVVEPPDLPVRPSRSINMAHLGEALTQLDDPPIAAMVVFNVNPAANSPNQLRVRKGLARPDLFTVVLEQRLTDTADYADVVLPATMQPEHMDLYGAYGHLYLSWNEPAVDPPGECLPNTEIFRRLATALGLTHRRLFDSDLSLARQLLDTDACRARGISLELLRERGWLRAAEFQRGTAPYAEGGFPTPSRKVELWSETLEARGQDPLVGYVPPHELVDDDLASRYPLVLVAVAGRFFLNSTFASIDWHRHKMGPIRVYVHPDDAAARGLEAGDAVRVLNDRGSFLAELIVDSAARTGVAFLHRSHWPKLLQGHANANATTTERDTDLGAAPTFHDNRVEIELLRPASTARAAPTESVVA